MKKKGFTLVELLAVITILAILVIIALPNVMGMFNTAKKNSFTTEVKQMMQVAEEQWISDGALGGTTKTIAYAKDVTCTASGSGVTVPTIKALDLSGRTNITYFFALNKAGKITHVYATDGTYVIANNNPSGIAIESIAAGDGADGLSAPDGSVRTITDFSGDHNGVTFSCSYNGTAYTITPAWN